MATTITTTNLRAMIEAELPDLIDMRHDLHAHPELGYQEHRTSGAVQEHLTAAGIDFKAGLARGTGVLATMPGRDERAVGLRADMDALPIQEQTDLPYTSTIPGKMHACGHDGHTTILLGTARVLARIATEMKSEGGLPRPVSFVFQPAEEGGAGADAMINDGCLDGSVTGPPIERMYGLHGWPQLEVGKIGTRPGPILAAADMFEITISGTGSHAAYPHLSTDPLLCATAVVQSLQQIASRNVDPLDAIVVSVTQIHSGTTHNIIPGTATIAGTVRTLQPQTQQLAQQRIKAIANGIAQAHNCTAEVTYHLGYPVTINDADAAATVLQIGEQALGAENVQHVDKPAMGGEDFSYYCHLVPSCFFILGLNANSDTPMPSLHQPTFDFNDDALAVGIEMFCRLALAG